MFSREDSAALSAVLIIAALFFYFCHGVLDAVLLLPLAFSGYHFFRGVVLAILGVQEEDEPITVYVITDTENEKVALKFIDEFVEEGVIKLVVISDEDKKSITDP